MSIKALNEFDLKATDWRKKLESQRGAVLAFETKVGFGFDWVLFFMKQVGGCHQCVHVSNLTISWPHAFNFLLPYAASVVLCWPSIQR